MQALKAAGCPVSLFSDRRWTLALLRVQVHTTVSQLRLCGSSLLSKNGTPVANKLAVVCNDKVLKNINCYDLPAMWNGSMLAVCWSTVCRQAIDGQCSLLCARIVQ